MQTFPLFLSLQDRRVLVVGGTDPAARKVELLLSAGAQVSLIADTVTGEIAQLIADGRICWAGRTFDDADLAGVSLVIVATEDEALQARVSHVAQARCVPVNVVDRPPLSSFIMPAIVDRGPITIAISTGGAAPALARKLRAEIERALPAAIGRLARFAEIFREPGPPHARRAARASPVLGSRVRRPGRRAGAGRRRDRRAPRADPPARSAAQRRRAAQGMVHLVGAGPGDPDLLTLKAHRLLQRADVVVYDRLVSPEVLAMARRDAERILVGKRRGHHAVPQEEINAAPGGAGARRQERGAAEGRRSVRVRPRWRGDRGADRRPASPSRSCPASRRRWAVRPAPASRSPIAIMPRPACSSPAISRTATGRSTGRCWRGRARPSSSTWALKVCRRSPRQLIAARPAGRDADRPDRERHDEPRAPGRRHPGDHRAASHACPTERADPLHRR